MIVKQQKMRSFFILRASPPEAPIPCPAVARHTCYRGFWQHMFLPAKLCSIGSPHTPPPICFRVLGHFIEHVRGRHGCHEREKIDDHGVVATRGAKEVVEELYVVDNDIAPQACGVDGVLLLHRQQELVPSSLDRHK
jgi:hypothetical protein